MPRNVRNFWIEIEVDGRKAKIATGPVSKTRGFTVRILQRGAHHECTNPVMTIVGREEDGGLECSAWIFPNTDQQRHIGAVRTRRTAGGVE